MRGNGAQTTGLGLAVVVVIVALAVFLAPRLYVADLEEALVRDANEIVAAPRPRPVHLDPARPGSFADALRGPLPRYAQGWKSLEGDDDAKRLLTAVARGERPLSDLSPEVRARLAALEPDLDALLAASRAERADLGPDHDPWGPFAGATWMALQAAAKQVAIRSRAAEGAAARARVLRECLDVLALGRDAALAGGLVGRMIRGAIVTIAAPPCGEILASAPKGEARDAAASLRRIRDAVPPFGAMLREERIQVALMSYGRGLSDERRARLLDRPRAFAADGAMERVDPIGRLRARLVFRDLRRFDVELVRAASTPAPEREASFAALGHAPLLVSLLLLGPNSPDPVESYAKYARRDEAAELHLDLLVAAAVARVSQGQAGRWPTSVEGFVAAGLLGADEARRLARLVVAEDRDGTLELTLPLPAADGSLTEAVLRLAREP